MKIGLAYDLRDDYLSEGYGEEETAEFDRVGTIDAIDRTLRELGYGTDRIGHARHLIARLAAGDRWDLVFNIAEGMHGIGRESQVPAILDVYAIPYTFSDPVVIGITLHKAFAKQILRDSGVPTPDFFVVEMEKQIPDVRLPYPLFAKPLAEGTGKGIGPQSKVRTPAELETVCRDLLHQFRQPVLVETFLPGEEVTVGIVGTGADAVALGAMEVVLLEQAEKEVYSYVNKERCEELVKYRLASPASSRASCAIALQAWRALGCRDAGRIDLRADAAGRFQLMELNPLAGIHPEHSDLPILCTLLGIPYVDLMDRIMRSALRRAGLTPPHREA